MMTRIGASQVGQRAARGGGGLRCVGWSLLGCPCPIIRRMVAGGMAQLVWSKPQCRTFLKPSGKPCWRNRRRNSMTSRCAVRGVAVSVQAWCTGRRVQFPPSAGCMIGGQKFKLGSHGDLRVVLQTAGGFGGGAFPQANGPDDPVLHGASVRIYTTNGDMFDNTYGMPDPADVGCGDTPHRASSPSLARLIDGGIAGFGYLSGGGWRRRTTVMCDRLPTVMSSIMRQRRAHLGHRGSPVLRAGLRQPQSSQSGGFPSIRSPPSRDRGVRSILRVSYLHRDLA